MSLDEVAYGFLNVANEAMTRPIRSLTEAKGHDISKHRLATFGGAGVSSIFDSSKDIAHDQSRDNTQLPSHRVLVYVKF